MNKVINDRVSDSDSQLRFYQSLFYSSLSIFTDKKQPVSKPEKEKQNWSKITGRNAKVFVKMYVSSRPGLTKLAALLLRFAKNYSSAYCSYDCIYILYTIS